MPATYCQYESQIRVFVLPRFGAKKSRSLMRGP